MNAATVRWFLAACCLLGMLTAGWRRYPSLRAPAKRFTPMDAGEKAAPTATSRRPREVTSNGGPPAQPIGDVIPRTVRSRAPQPRRRGATKRPTSESHQWSCLEEPTRCAIVYHGFLGGRPTDTGAGGDPRTFYRPVGGATLYFPLSLEPEVEAAFNASAMRHQVELGPELWMCVLSALSIRRSLQEDVTAGGEGYREVPVVLMTNYAPVAVEWLRRLWSEFNGGTAYGQPWGPWPFDAITYVPTATYVTKSDALAQPIRRMDGSLYDRVLYLDSDTQVTSGEQLMTALELLERYDLSMVGEGKSFSHMGPFLYREMIGRETFGAALEEWDTVVKPPGATVAPTRSKKKRHVAFMNAAFYEQQYNTGLVGYRQDAAVGRFFQLWSAMHRSHQRCRDDKVAWDQCSLPLALRWMTGRGTSNASEAIPASMPLLRVGQLPDAFNFREALGYGCSTRLYPLRWPQPRRRANETSPRFAVLPVWQWVEGGAGDAASDTTAAPDSGRCDAARNERLVQGKPWTRVLMDNPMWSAGGGNRNAAVVLHNFIKSDMLRGLLRRDARDTFDCEQGPMLPSSFGLLFRGEMSGGKVALDDILSCRQGNVLGLPVTTEAVQQASTKADRGPSRYQRLTECWEGVRRMLPPPP